MIAALCSLAHNPIVYLPAMWVGLAYVGSFIAGK